MEDDSYTSSKTSVQIKPNAFLESLKHEWSLFWASFSEDGDTDQKQKTSYTLEMEKLSNIELNEIIKQMSSYKKEIHKRIEDIQQEIEENQLKIESVQLVGGEIDGILEDIEALREEGFTLTEEIDKIDLKLKSIRNVYLENRK